MKLRWIKIILLDYTSGIAHVFELEKHPREHDMEKRVADWAQRNKIHFEDCYWMELDAIERHNKEVVEYDDNEEEGVENGH